MSTRDTKNVTVTSKIVTHNGDWVTTTNEIKEEFVLKKLPFKVKDAVTGKTVYINSNWSHIEQEVESTPTTVEDDFC